MIRGALRLAIAGAGIGYALDRVLAGQAKGTEPDPIDRSSSSTRRSRASGRTSPTSKTSRAG